MTDYSETSQSGAISGSLDALSSKFTNYVPLPVSSHQLVNVLFRAQRYGRYYVLKGLAPEYRDDPVWREYLSKEYQIGVQLDHPHIVRVNSLEEDPKAGLCIVMEYVDGQNLDQWLATKPSASARKKIFRQILDAMAYCHERQVWHLDLKPSNILITKDGLSAKIIDFGLSDNSVFAFRQTGGTRKYAAPEQLEGQTADYRSDIYALGGILKRMFPHRYSRAVRCTQRANPDKRPQSVAELSKLMHPWWLLFLLPVILLTVFFCWWMHPDGKRFPVTLDSGQTVYARVLSHWQRKVSLVCPSDERLWRNYPDAPSGDMVIPAQIKHRGLCYRVVELDSNAFRNCVELTHLTLPEGLQKIGWCAFSGCNRISDTLVIPCSLKLLEECSFADCHSLTTLVWKAKDCSTSVSPDHNSQFFYRCNNLKKIIVDDSVYNLPGSVFSEMNWLQEIVLPNHIRELPDNFACYSVSLKECRLPDSLRKIDHAAFYQSGIESIVIPDQTEEIEGYSFSYCFLLRKVDIGSGLKRIDSYAFNENKALETMTIHCEKPPVMMPNSLYGIPENAVLYVPAQSVEKYRMDPVWSKFKKIEAIRE